MNDNPFLKVGITGGIGTGKSTVCRFFRELGRVVLEADEIARQIMGRDRELLEQIRRVFGERVFLGNGVLDRKRLAGEVFSSRELLSALNAIVHPRVFEEIERLLREVPPAKSQPYVLIEAALVYESGMDEALDYVVVVVADKDTSLGRVMKRDHATREQVQQRIRSQLDMAEKARRADFVIHNDSTVTDLRPKVVFLDRILSMIQPAPKT